MPLGCTADLSRRFRLRTATSRAHARLDALVEAGAFLRSRNRYHGYLYATYRARCAAEAGLDAAHAEISYAAWPSRRIATALRADMADLDPTAPLEAAVALHFGSAPAVLGGLYVLEGSALGARLLASRLVPIGLSEHFGGRHMRAQTSDPAAWRQFVKILNDYPMSAAEEADCIASAAAVFECFERELSALVQLV